MYNKATRARRVLCVGCFCQSPERQALVGSESKETIATLSEKKSTAETNKKRDRRQHTTTKAKKEGGFFTVSSTEQQENETRSSNHAKSSLCGRCREEPRLSCAREGVFFGRRFIFEKAVEKYRHPKEKDPRNHVAHQAQGISMFGTSRLS